MIIRRPPVLKRMRRMIIRRPVGVETDEENDYPQARRY